MPEKTLSETLSDIAVQAVKVQAAAEKLDEFSDKIDKVDEKQQDHAIRISSLELKVEGLLKIAYAIGGTVFLAVLTAIVKLVLQ